MQNKKITVLLVLVILAAISLIYGIATPTKRKNNVRLKQETIQPHRLVSSTVEVRSTERNAAKTEFASWGRNPFVPKGSPGKPGGPKLTVDGIMWREKNPKAIINNALVGVGDTISGSTVVDIKKDRVIFNDGTEYFEVRMSQKK